MRRGQYRFNGYRDEVSKQCPKCTRILPKTQYHSFIKNLDGLQSYCKECKREGTKRYFKNRRLEVLKYYSKAETPFCICCNETTYEFLAIDHSNGDGAAHRKRNNLGGDICWWLVRNKFPEGFRVLCHNCNLALGFYGYCPHTKEKLIST